MGMRDYGYNLNRFFVVSGEDKDDDKAVWIEKTDNLLKGDNRKVSSLELHWCESYGKCSSLMAK